MYLANKRTVNKLGNIRNAVGLFETCGTNYRRSCSNGLECQGSVGVRNPMSKGTTMRHGYDVASGTCQPSEFLYAYLVHGRIICNIRLFMNCRQTIVLIYKNLIIQTFRKEA